MSFNFGVGHVLAVSKFARSIWGQVRDSSDQLNAICTESDTVIDKAATNLVSGNNYNQIAFYTSVFSVSIFHKQV